MENPISNPPKIEDTTNPNRIVDVSVCLINGIRHLITDEADPNKTNNEGNILLHLIASGRFVPSAAVYTRPIDGLDELSDKEYKDIWGYTAKKIAWYGLSNVARCPVGNSKIFSLPCAMPIEYKK